MSDRKEEPEVQRDESLSNVSITPSRKSIKDGANFILCPSRLGDPVLCLEFDERNYVLFTGTAKGGVYAWQVDYIIGSKGLLNSNGKASESKWWWWCMWVWGGSAS